MDITKKKKKWLGRNYTSLLQFSKKMYIVYEINDIHVVNYINKRRNVQVERLAYPVRTPMIETKEII